MELKRDGRCHPSHSFMFELGDYCDQCDYTYTTVEQGVDVVLHVGNEGSYWTERASSMSLRPTPVGPIPRVLSVCVPLSPSPLWCERNRSVAVRENLSKVTPQSIHVVSVAGPSADPCLWDRFEIPRMPSTDLKIRIGILAARAPVHGGQYWFAHTTSRLKKATHAGPVVPSIPLPTNRPHFFRNLTIIGGIQQHIHTSPSTTKALSFLKGTRSTTTTTGNRARGALVVGLSKKKRRRDQSLVVVLCCLGLVEVFSVLLHLCV